MTEPLDVVRRLYDAFAAWDAAALTTPLHPDFVAEVAPGMPYGMGGVHRGPHNVLTEVWGVAVTHYDIRPVPDSYVTAEDGTVVATGHYRGTARTTGKAVDAEFAHIWSVADGRVTRLHQYTDTARWVAALSRP